MSVAVSVVIPVRNDARGLPEAVASVLAQVDVSPIEILLCVGPSQDGTEQVASELEATHDIVRVLASPTGHIPAALNLGLDAVRGDVLARLDARAVLPPDYLARALDALADTGAANVAAIQRPVGTTTVQRAIAHAMGHRFGSGAVAYRHAETRQWVDTGFLGVFDVARLRRVGGWDPRMLRNEDAELNVRLGAVGGVLVDPAMVVNYAPRSSLRGLLVQYFLYGRWRAVTIRLHPESRKLRHLIPPLAISLIGASAVAALWFPLLVAVPVAYAAGLVSAAPRTSGVAVAERVLVPIALAIMHFSWSAGFVTSLLTRRLGARSTPDAERR